MIEKPLYFVVYHGIAGAGDETSREQRGVYCYDDESKLSALASVDDIPPESNVLLIYPDEIARSTKQLRALFGNEFYQHKTQTRFISGIIPDTTFETIFDGGNRIIPDTSLILADELGSDCHVLILCWWFGKDIFFSSVTTANKRIIMRRVDGATADTHLRVLHALLDEITKRLAQGDDYPTKPTINYLAIHFAEDDVEQIQRANDKVSEELPDVNIQAVKIDTLLEDIKGDYALSRYLALGVPAHAFYLSAIALAMCGVAWQAIGIAIGVLQLNAQGSAIGKLNDEIAQTNNAITALARNEIGRYAGLYAIDLESFNDELLHILTPNVRWTIDIVGARWEARANVDLSPAHAFALRDKLTAMASCQTAFNFDDVMEQAEVLIKCHS